GERGRLARFRAGLLSPARALRSRRPPAGAHREHPFQPILEDQLGMEILHLQIMDSGVYERLSGHQSDDFASQDLDALRRGFAPDRVENHSDARGLKIGEVHRDLGQAAGFEIHSHGFDAREAAARSADLLGNGFRYAHLWSVEVDVVGDQKLARSDYRRARRGVQSSLPELRTKVRLALGIGEDFLADAFKLPAPDVLEVAPLGPARRRFVKVSGNLEPSPRLF